MGWLWYLGTMLPMIGFIQTGRQGMADRFMHIPVMGLLLALV
jgi:protein O-mannosyl-transferase